MQALRIIANNSRRAFSTQGAGALEGKVIVVAGAGNPPEEGHGIGAMTSLVLARQGAKVVSVSNEELNCQTVTDAIIAEGNVGMAFTADCTQGSQVQVSLRTLRTQMRVAFNPIWALTSSVLRVWSMPSRGNTAGWTVWSTQESTAPFQWGSGR